MPDPLALLEQDHRSVERLFEQFEKHGDADMARRICQELRLHDSLEEDLIYPLVDGKLDGELARRSRVEHRTMRDLIGRIERLRIGDGGLRPLMAELKQAVLEHVAEEESTVFPKMEGNLEEELSALEPELARRRQASLSELEAELKRLRTGVNRLARVHRRVLSEELEAMTKAELQIYADEADIADVDQYRQTKDEMLQTIRAEIG